jgi:hypothetical protein
VLIFASVAAVGAGLEVAVDYDTHVTHVSGLAAGFPIAVAVAVYLLMVWALHVLPRRGAGPVARFGFPVVAVLVLLAPFTPAPVHVIAVLLAVLASVKEVGRRSVPPRLALDGP